MAVVFSPTIAGSSLLKTLLITSCKSVFPTMSANLIFKSCVCKYLPNRDKNVSLVCSDIDRSTLMLTLLMLSFCTISSPGRSLSVSSFWFVMIWLKAFDTKLTPRHMVGFSLFTQSLTSFPVALEMITIKLTISRSLHMLCIFEYFWKILTPETLHFQSPRKITEYWLIPPEMFVNLYRELFFFFCGQEDFFFFATFLCSNECRVHKELKTAEITI